MPAIVEKLCRYPVKGLSPETLDAVDLAVGAGLPDDRRFAIAHGGEWRERGGWMPKRHFLTLMTYERLAALETEFDSETGVLTIRRKGRQVARGDITVPIGRALIDQFFAAYMQGEAVGTPRIVEQSGVMFGDTAEPLVSIINLASVSDLERVTRRPVDPLRFRGNIMVAGVRPWA
ncbi:MAG: MOSC domain-containing protein, partial [Inquilinus sp.]|nr:MOSC domain-containing protein [Inquilinus sp.]